MASPDRGGLEVAARRLRAGGVVAFPTETVYGLAADAMDEAAVRRVFELKGRPADRPMSVIVEGVRGAQRATSAWPEEAAALARRFWPGPLTIVVPRSPELPDLVTAGRPTVGVRCPDHPVALALVELFGGPLVGPSANPSGLPSPTSAEHVRRFFRSDEVLVLDGGPCREGIESTVLAVEADGMRVLREGAIPASVLGVEVRTPEGGTRSPGSVRVVEADALDEAGAAVSGRAIVVTCDPERRIAAPHERVLLPADAPGYARHFYGAILDAAASGAAAVIVELPARDDGLWRSIRQRLLGISAARG